MVKIVREKVYGLRKENSLGLNLECTELTEKRPQRKKSWKSFKDFILPEGSPVNTAERSDERSE